MEYMTFIGSNAVIIRQWANARGLSGQVQLLDDGAGLRVNGEVVELGERVAIVDEELDILEPLEEGRRAPSEQPDAGSSQVSAAEVIDKKTI